MVDTDGQEREVDVEYYIKHQILPPVRRILNYFDFDDSELSSDETPTEYYSPETQYLYRSTHLQTHPTNLINEGER